VSIDAVEITNQLYRYALLVDSGDFAGLETLFAHVQTKILGESELQNGMATVEMLRSVVRIYPCGTPRTKHVITNPLIEFEEEGSAARCRSYYTVLQATPDLPLQVIASGRYDDRFEKREGQWRFAYRDYTLFDLPGDVSAHLVLPAGIEAALPQPL
jgi:3-phenylpropionate/cinnamic acid dioxygenase small subunit